MKFTQNTSIMNPNTINAQYRAVTDPMAYGTAGKDYEAMAGAVGQVVKFAQQKQDEHDASDLMQARNEIMGNITNQMYGEKGLMTLGVGENAQGLQDRVTKTIQDTFDKISKKYNPRVRKALKGNLNENMANYQRIAGQQEGREYVKMQDVNYSSSQAMNLDRAVAGFQDDTTLEVTVNDSLRMLQGYGALKGWSGAQMQEEERKLFSALGGSAIQAAMDNGDLTRADILNHRYGPYMDQATRMKFDVALKKNADIQESRTMGGDLVKKFGKNKQAAYNYIFNDLAKQTVTVSSGGGAYFSDAGVNDEIVAAAQEFNVDPALVAAVAQAESNGSQSALSGAGAIGVMQLMPDTAASLGVDPYNRKDNIRGGAKYLRQMLDTFGGDVRKALAAYNAGPDAVKQYGGVPPYKETQNYVAKIMDGTPDSGEAFYSSKKRVGGATVKPYQMPTQGASIDEQVGNLKDTWKHGVMDWVGGVVKDVFHYSNPTISSAARSSARNAQVSTSGDKSWHVHNDALDVVFDEGQNLSQKEKDALVKYFKDTGMFSEVLYHNYGSGWHLHLGGLKSSNPPQGGGSSYTKRKYSETQLQAFYRQYEAQLSDQIQTENYQKQEQTKSYIEGLKGLGSQSDVIAYLDKIKASADVETYSRVASAAHGYYPEYFSRSRSRSGGGAGSGSGAGRSHGTNGYYGKSGKWYSAAKFQEAENAVEEYKRLRALSDQGLYTIGSRQKYFNEMASIANDVYDNNYTDIGMVAAKKAFDEAKGDLYTATSILAENAGMDQAEASRYLQHYLGNQSDDDDE